MAEIGLSVAAKTAEYTVDPIARQFGYMWDYKSNFQNLEKQVQKLQSRRDMVQHSIDDATKNGEEIERHVVNWLDNVKKMIDEAAEIITDNNQANMRCFKRLCPDLKKRYQHSKKAAVMAKDVSELENEGKFDRISYRTFPKETWHPSSKLYEDFESRRSTVDDILNELRHPGVKMVGVHGMGGIGKTTLAREVGKQAEEQKLFDAVVFVEVSEKPDIRKIQEAIADKLGLEFRESSESGRARTLCERLKKESKLLLILDNIWKGLDLETVGIPFGNDHSGCKLLLTARSIDVLSNDMNSLSNFSIDGLHENEAWDLFKKVAGACIEQHDLQSLAFDVAERCGGLPIAIVTIAKALKDKPVHAWKNALRELKRPSSENLVGSVTAQTYSCIWLSYNHLETDELKSTFLLCSTMEFASGASVEELLRYGMGLRLFKLAYTMEEARDRVKTLVQKLKESSLLLDHRANGWFSIHDVVRDVGRAIASKDENKITVIDDVIPWELKDKNIMKKCTSLSLYDITELPNEEFNCPTLEFLYMESNSNSSEIPDNFFRGMPNLRVLHLMEMELSPLPTSLGCLVNLRTLCLNCYFLRDMGFIEDMKELEILVLSCDIEQLPKEVGQLTQLRVLDLRRCFNINVIPPNTISKLSKLEELYMPYQFNEWQLEGVTRSNVSLEELKDLSQLTALQICIRDAKIVPKGLFSQKLQRYKIRLGVNGLSYFGWDKTSRLLSLEYHDGIYVENIVFKQLKGIEELYLIGKQGAENVLYELNRADFPQLKHFDVQDNSDLVYIVDSSKQSEPCDAFPRLETLSIRNVISLEKICHGELMLNSFCRLRNVKVEDCDKLKNFFSFTIAGHLSKLQEIKVTNCENMEEFFTMGRRNEVIVLDRLQFLCLKNLPKLRRFCSEAEVASSSDQEKHMLDTPMPFFDGKVEFPNLKTLELRKMNVDKIWHNQLSSMSSCFQNLTDLVISDCCNLKYIFASSTLRSFVQLQCLKVCNCKVLEEIIRIDDLGNIVELLSLKKLSIKECPEMKEFIFSDKVSFPSLEEIEIYNCMILEEVIRIDDGGNNVELLSLKKLSIVGCPEMKTFNCNDKVEVPNLKTLELRTINVEKIWHNLFCFQNLTVLIISDCCNLKYIFASSTLTSFVQLQCLEVFNCKLLEEIIRIDDLKKNVELLSLKKLSIKGCPELKAFVFGDKDFCSGNIHNVNFPSLEIFIAIECLKMNIFSSVEASTPMLRKMNLDFMIYDCKGDVNTTIQHIQHMQRHIYENEPFQPTRAPVPAPGHSHSQAFNASDDLPKTVIRTLNQGSSPMSMDFHPVQQTLLLVGTNVGDIGLWEVGSRERLVLKNFKVLDLSACTMPLQAALVKDPGVSVNRVKWSPGGSLFGVAYSRHIVQIHAYNGGDDVRQHLEIDAHVGGVNDLAFSRPIKQLCVITCGDDKTIKVWDAATGAKQYIFEGHDAPVYSVFPHYKENIQFIFSTALDGKIKAWLYDNLGSRVDYNAPGCWCTTMAYSTDGTRLFSCGTSKDGESYIVEWNESEGTIKRAYQGLHKRSLGVVQFDTTKNRFLAAGDDFSIKFWDMDNLQLLNSIDADGGLPASPHIRFNKDGSLLAVSANENGIKILANSEGMRLLRNYETLSYDASRTSGASKPAINPISAAATSAGLADRGASVVSIAGMNGDARSLGDVKPRMTEESNDKSKIWKLTEINEPSQCP